MKSENFNRVAPNRWRLPAGWIQPMRTAVEVIARESLLERLCETGSIVQLVRVSTLPGICEPVVGMPDMHEGFGFPNGVLAATRFDEGVVSPGGVGFDINCGMRVLSTGIPYVGSEDLVDSFVDELDDLLSPHPRSATHLKLSDDDIGRLLEQGAKFLVESRDVGRPDDVRFDRQWHDKCPASASRVSIRARIRGAHQLGSTGAGEHSIKIQTVDEIYDERRATDLGLRQGDITVTIHVGSLGLGHQVCVDYLEAFGGQASPPAEDVDGEGLPTAPLGSELGARYLSAIAAAANFGYGNRQVLTDATRTAAERAFGARHTPRVRVEQDHIHNMATVETIGDDDVCLHRKTALNGIAAAHFDRRREDSKTFTILPGNLNSDTFILSPRDLEAAAGESCEESAPVEAGGERETGSNSTRDGIMSRCGTNAGRTGRADRTPCTIGHTLDAIEGGGGADRIARLRTLRHIRSP